MIGFIAAWHNERQKDSFVKAWGLQEVEDINVYLVQDANHEGCAKTKNRGIQQAYADGCDYFIVVDDDCYPSPEIQSLSGFVQAHITELNKFGKFEGYRCVTDPASRGTPYTERLITKPVGISMGFWDGVPDYDAYSEFQGKGKPDFHKSYFYKHYISLSGMNFAFTREFAPLMKLIEVERFDDIWMGWIAQKYLYDMGYCVSTFGPMVYHSRQSDTHKNLIAESKNLVKNETLWKKIDAIRPLYVGDVEKDYEYLISQLKGELHGNAE